MNLHYLRTTITSVYEIGANIEYILSENSIKDVSKKSKKLKKIKATVSKKISVVRGNVGGGTEDLL